MDTGPISPPALVPDPFCFGTVLMAQARLPASHLLSLQCSGHSLTRKHDTRPSPWAENVTFALHRVGHSPKGAWDTPELMPC